MTEAIQFTIKDMRFYVRNAPMRMPFRFGSVTLTGSAILYVRTEIERANGQRATGWAADMLAPKWYDKDPTKDYAESLGELLDSVRAAGDTYEQIGREANNVFRMWQQGYEEMMAWRQQRGVNRLMASNGASLQERALIDAVGIASGLSYHNLLSSGGLGIQLGEVHEELGHMSVGHAIAPTPLTRLSVRHTVGLIDPIRTSDIAPESALGDGLPQSLEDYVSVQGVRYVKIKIGGDAQSDFERLSEIAALLDEQYLDSYRVTLDGNEQYGDMDALIGLLERVEREIPRMYDSLLYVEQPLDRSVALDRALAPSIRSVSERKPMLIDESDEDLNTFRYAVDLGYRGVSSKACKGMIKALSNAALVQHLNGETNRYLLSAEDLTNIPVVGLHQDLTHVAALGIGHVERNGHHYVRGLDHLSDGERAQCRERHRTLYEDRRDLLTLAIDKGQIDVQSLQTPGLGSGDLVDLDAVVPLEDWSMDSLVESNR